MRVAVIGAGIVGASVAYRLSQEGAKVYLIDRTGPASGTTSASFAWINANNKTPREYFELNHAGMKEHFRLHNELSGGTSWLHQGGNLIQVEKEAFKELEDRVERLRSRGYATEWCTASQVKTELEPCLVLPNSDMPVAYFPKESWVDAPLLTHTLISLARQNGADAYFGKPVEFVEMDGRRVKGVTLSGSTRLPADAVVNAAGPDADRIAATVERRLPLAPKSGLLVRVRTEEEFVSRLVHTPRVNLRPDGPRSLLLHHGSVDEKLAEGRPPEVLGFELLARAQEMVSELEAAEVEEVRVGVRPIPVDGYPCVGAAADISGYYEAVTHSGITLGPLVGRLLAQEVLTGKRNPLLAAFRPDRYAL